jgi:steroid delta-isomerase
VNTHFSRNLSRRLATAFAGLFLLTVFAAPSRAQGFDPEQGIRTYFEKVKAYDFKGWSELFTPDGTLEDPVGTPVHRGPKELYEFVSTIAAPSVQIDYSLGDVVVVSPTEAAAQWNLHIVLYNGREVNIEGIGAFRFNEDGKLREVREYWDLAGYLAQNAGQTPVPPVFHFESQLRQWFETGSSLDIDGYVALYTPDGVVEDPVGTPAYRGHKAIRDHLRSLTGPFVSLNFTIEKIIPVTDTEAAVEWSLEAPTTYGKVVRLNGFTFFRYNEDGKLRAAAEYWSVPELLGQL